MQITFIHKIQTYNLHKLYKFVVPTTAHKIVSKSDKNFPSTYAIYSFLTLQLRTQIFVAYVIFLRKESRHTRWTSVCKLSILISCFTPYIG